MINFSSNYSVHFVGIGGVSMHKLALFCLSLGWKVSGSDIRDNKYVEVCRKAKIPVFIGHNKKNILSPSFIVKSGGVSLDNVEIDYALSLGIKVYDRAEFLGEITKQFPLVIAIAGSHGKSTTASIVYEILKRANKRVSCHIGADVEGEKINLKDEIFVVEACEYNKSFLRLKIDVGAITNIDLDHLECYGGFSQLKASFLTFLKRAKFRHVIDCETTKFINLKNVNRVSCTHLGDNKFLYCGGIYNLPNLMGEQYIMDACLAIDICHQFNIDYKTIYDTLKSFRPLKRRQEVIGKFNNSEVIIDYAHHPTEIYYLKKTFKGYKTLYIFQPHLLSRTKYLKNDFINVFLDTDVVLYKEYASREKEVAGMTSKELFFQLNKVNKNAFYASSLCELRDLISLKDYEKILFVGAGDINEVAEKLVKSDGKS